MNKTTFLLNDIVPFENDERHNSFDEVKDWRTIPKYDLVLLEYTDSNENELYFVDKNNEYTEPRVMI